MQKQGSIMSRRKQSNPKPLLKSECHELKGETVEKEANQEDLEEDLENSDETNAHFNSATPSPSPSNVADKDGFLESPSISNESHSQVLPKLRLNPVLASDPALKAEAVLLTVLAEGKPSEESNKCDSDNESVKKNNPEIVNKFKVFTCQPCGIGFSSLSTLEAHQNFYCSHRRESEEEISSTNLLSENSGETSSKSVKTGRQYTCTQCSYSADKKVSLNRHMRMHQTSPISNISVSNGDESSSQQVDRYCSECDIHFSNVKTYRAHKEHYCRSRRIESQSSTRSSPKSPLGQPKTPSPHLQPFLALPTSPMLIIPYSLIKTATIISSPLPSVSTGEPSSNSICYAYENGSLRPLAKAIIKDTRESKDCTVENISKIDNVELARIIGNNSNNMNKHTALCTKEIPAREFIPLDLSLRRPPCIETHANMNIDVSVLDKAAEIRLIPSGKVSPEDIICAPSLPNSPPSSPPTMVKLTTSPHAAAIAAGRASPQILAAEILNKVKKSQLSMDLTSSKTASKISGSKSSDSQSLFNFPINVVSSVVNMTPQIYVKQGVSKCKECNIVFCKYENYLAHKQHYCSARNQDTVEREDHTSAKEDNNEVEHTPAVAYQQLICAACGIKYASLDNLRAHQTFYCPKGNDLPSQTAVSNESCLKCKTNHESGRCPLSQDSFKCPVCDYISANAIESRNHLEKHGSVKAFRCSLCHYKGNTLRGMRTHIRMHFDNKTSDISEENYMTCIVEDDAEKIVATESTSTDHLKQPALISVKFDFSSTHKGNNSTAKHSKCVEPQINLRATFDDEEGETVSERKSVYEDNERNAISNDSTETKLSSNINEEQEDTKEGICSNVETKTKMSSTPPLASEENICPLKYCQACDIKFKYLNSYIAHKKFYCKSGKNQESQDISQILPASSKNKENFENVL